MYKRKKQNYKANIIVLLLFIIFVVVLTAGLIKDRGFGETTKAQTENKNIFRLFGFK
jgi:hypothetical protein